MTCPQIYLGRSRMAAPLPADYANDAIGISGAPIPASSTTVIPVTVKNHGTDNSPATTVELYWSDPTTGFHAVYARRIGSPVGITAGIPGAISSPVLEGERSAYFGWAPDPSIVGVNGGYVCLMAIAYNTTPPRTPCVQQTNNSASPATDPLSALYNVQVIAAQADPCRDPDDPGDPRDPYGDDADPRGREATGDGDSGERRDRVDPGRRPMWFAFAATNILRDQEDTKLHVRALDPVTDRAKLQRLVALPALHRELSCRRLKFALPTRVQVAAGRERLLVPLGSDHGPREPGPVDPHACVPRMSRLGAMTNSVALRHLLPGAKLLDATHGPIDLKLLPGEQQQTFVRVEPSGREHELYAIEVRHEGADGRPIGGLELLFISPHDYF